jgi:hypothetical protein
MSSDIADMKFYVYKCVFDDGGAPCVYDGLLTLTICKPYIRRKAAVGDLIFAFGSNSDTEVPPNRLVYIAVVGQPTLRGGGYFTDPRFMLRPDCIYEQVGRTFKWKQGANFHLQGSGKKSDLGPAPKYPNANALICDDFRYFGGSGDNSWKHSSPMLKDLVENLRQGHRVNFVPELEAELRRLRDEIWSRYPSQKTMGKPLHGPGVWTGDKHEEGCVAVVQRKRCNAYCD